MRCEEDGCDFMIRGTKRYNPMSMQFYRLYWDEYVDYELHMFSAHSLASTKSVTVEDYRKDLDKLKRWLDKNPEYIGCTGDHKPSLKGMRLHFSWRGWGQMMACYMNSRIRKRRYHYMDFYIGLIRGKR